MRVRLDRYETANQSVQSKSTLAFVFGGIGLVFFGFITFLGLMMIAMPDSEGGGIWAARSGIFLGFFVGGVPTLVSALLIWWGVRKRAHFRKFGELAAASRQMPMVSSAQVAHALRLTPAQADALLIEATGLGLIDASAAAPNMIANAVTAPAHANAHALGIAPTLGPISPASPAAYSGPMVGGAAVATGTVLGAYRIEEPLGRGGMGAVFAARHLRTGRRYAVKTILAGANASEATIRRFEREATAASALGHPGIVQVHDFDQAAGGVFYLVMDLLEGETLQARIDRGGALPWSDAQRIGIELCDALAAAHEHGLLHRDIKPSNIFLAKAPRSTQTERTVIVDFGLVKPVEESGSMLTSTGAVLGTPMYMSPEQARGEALDFRSDLYSLAAVVFEMTTGAPPFKDRSLASAYARILNEPPPAASRATSSTIPPAIDPILQRALAKDRTARFANVRELGSALAAVGEEGVPATVGVPAPVTERLGS